MEATTDKLVADLKALISDAEELLRATANNAGEQVAVVRRRIEESLKEGKRTLSDAEDILFEKTRDAAEAASDYVQKNPWSAVGIAAGLGLVLGLLIRRD
ncbi:MAG TPA: DUF883 family protein [Candidatus Binatia bacterium]|jgi:ElaB/YqjD/DUF883 family membrane-anchored ribosome-binding protein